MVEESCVMGRAANDSLKCNIYVTVCTVGEMCDAYWIFRDDRQKILMIG